MKPKGICNELMHDIENGICNTCTYNVPKEPDYKKIMTATMQNDTINPNHYTKWKIAPNEYITANNLEWEVGNIVKYITRYEDKNGLEDLRKAEKYLHMLMERKYGA